MKEKLSLDEVIRLIEKTRGWKKSVKKTEHHDSGYLGNHEETETSNYRASFRNIQILIAKRRSEHYYINSESDIFGIHPDKETLYTITVSMDKGVVSRYKYPAKNIKKVFDFVSLAYKSEQENKRERGVKYIKKILKK